MIKTLVAVFDTIEEANLFEDSYKEDSMVLITKQGFSILFNGLYVTKLILVYAEEVKEVNK